MRFLVIALMIALLPLRGWAGEVMATEMASSQIERTHRQAENATELVADSVRINWDTAAFEGEKSGFGAQKRWSEVNALKKTVMHDCEGHVEANSTAPADAYCDSCPACQACHTVALSTAAINLNLTFSPRTLPRAVAAQFASAIAALGQKPPIS